MAEWDELKQFLGLLQGHQSQDELNEEHVERFIERPDMVLRLVVSAAAGASNRIAVGDLSEAIVCQKQSDLWLRIHERLREIQTQQAFDAEVRRLEETEPEPDNTVSKTDDDWA